MLDFISLKDTLKSKFYPVFVVFGDDEWVKSKAIENIAASLAIEFPDMNKYVYEQGGDIDEILMSCNTLPFFSPQKIVVVENFVFPIGKKQQEVKQKIEKYARSADNSCVLVFSCTDNKPFGQIEFVEFVNCNRLSQNSLIAWIVAFVNKRGKKIDKFAASKLCNYCLNDMARINTEITKLCDYCIADVSEKDVELLVHKDAEYVVFNLSRAIANKDASQSLEIVRALLNRGEEVRSLFALLYNFYRRMFYIRVAKYSSKDIAQYLGVKESAIGFTKEIADKYKPSELKTALEYFESVDAKLKAFYNDVETLEFLILQLVSL
ncbi:MAG: DNA polymerase III subunit delta [Corallococcus sp.]|nr:DNA polymerase III subunit delta [Corallococcus sp.]